MKFQGQLGSVFDGFTTIRGYAKFSDIVKYSEPKDYQRSLMPDHLKEQISKYYGLI